MSTTIERLYKEYTREYEYIYENNCQGKEVAGESQAVDFFDKVILKEEFELLNEFNIYVGDPIMSDREAAAFVFACETLGFLNNAKVNEFVMVNEFNQAKGEVTC